MNKDFQKIFSGALCLAPMEDVTEIPFRLVCKELGADIVYTEFISSDGLIRDVTKSKRKMALKEEERPIAIQIFGGDESTMEGAAQIAEEAQADFIDINCGCWVKNVALRGAGAGLLRDLPRMQKIAERIVKSVHIPVTLKTRLGWDSESIRIVEVAKMLEDVGIQALTIHCRTRDQGHSGQVDWSWIPKVKKAVSIPIILNGDVNSPQDVKRAFDETGTDAVMIGRGAISNPWIFGEAKTFLKSGEIPPAPSIQQRIEICLKHLHWAVEFKGEAVGVREMRKHYSGYLKGLPNIAKIRAELMTPEYLVGVLEILYKIPEYYYKLNQPYEKIIPEPVYTD